MALNVRVNTSYMTEATRSTESLDKLVLDSVAIQTIRALATRQNSKRGGLGHRFH